MKKISSILLKIFPFLMPLVSVCPIKNYVKICYFCYAHLLGEEITSYSSDCILSKEK